MNEKTSLDLTTKYLGLTLKNPLIASASPLSHKLETIQKLEEAGASAVVFFSLFEEQIVHESLELQHHSTFGTESFAEALSYFPEPSNYVLTPDEYLVHLAEVKRKVKIPIIGSLNGFTKGGWIKYAKRIQEAGADALELNIYYLPTDFSKSAADVEQQYLDVFQTVKSSVTIPVAVKLSPYFSSMANMAKKFDDAGADGLVLFNRFYQPDIDLENLEVVANVLLSTPQAMRLPLRWIAILYGHLKCDLAATSGIHNAQDVLKMLMAGANATMLCSTLLKNGPQYMQQILTEMTQWMQEREYESVQQMQGSMSQKSCPNPQAFERANYIKVLESYAYNPVKRS